MCRRVHRATGASSLSMPLEATLLPSATHSEPRPPAAGRASTGSWQSWLFSPVDISFLVVFRVAFGAIMLWHVERYFSKGEIESFYIAPKFHFTYWGFEWVQPWPGVG